MTAIAMEFNSFYNFQKLLIMVTNKCNLKCRMCQIIKEEKGSLTRDEAFKLAEFGIKYKFDRIEISGGEPFLMPYIFDLLQYLCENHLKVHIVTNATTFDDDSIKRISKLKNINLMVSIDGVTESHDEIRGEPGVFKIVERNLRKLEAAGVKLSVNTVIQKLNINDLLVLYRLLSDLSLAFHTFCLVENGNFRGDDKIAISANEADSVIGQLRNIMVAAKKDERFVFPFTHELINIYRQRLIDPCDCFHSGLDCSVVKKNVIVKHNGLVFPCFHTSWDTRKVERNIRQKDISDIIFSKEYLQEITEKQRPGGCSGCSTLCYIWDHEFYQKILQTAQ